MRKPTLRERAANYVSRTLPCLGLEAYIWCWAERAWLAGYRAGARDNRPPDKYECEIGGCGKPHTTLCKHWKKER